MVDAAELQQIEAQLCTLMNERLGLKQPSLARAAKRAGRRLPKRQHRQVETISDALKKVEHPALFAQISDAELHKASTQLQEHLEGIDRRKQKIDNALRLTATLAFNLLVVAGIVIVLLRLRGFV